MIFEKCKESNLKTESCYITLINTILFVKRSLWTFFWLLVNDKSITGSYSFFNQDVEKNVGTLNYHANTTSSMNVYVVMSGNFTPNQRQIIKSRSQVDIGHFQRIYTWLRENNPIYSKMADIPNCPMPIIIEAENVCW